MNSLKERIQIGFVCALAALAIGYMVREARTRPNACADAGGVAVRGAPFHRQVCVKLDAVIDLTKEQPK